MSATEIPSAVDWARENGDHYRYVTAVDNHDPTRDYATGDLYAYSLDDSRGSGIILEMTGGALRDAKHATYLVDDGRTVTPFYVAGWNDDRGYVMLHPFPTNYEADGSPRLRANDRRPVDFGSWMLGPRRSFHLKATRAQKEI